MVSGMLAQHSQHVFVQDKFLKEQVDVQFVREFKRLISLNELKSAKPLQDMALVRQGRLSVQVSVGFPPQKEQNHILRYSP